MCSNMFIIRLYFSLTSTSVVTQLLTKVGLKGGSTFRCSRAAQSVALKKLCCLMFPFTPSRPSGSLTNNCRHTTEVTHRTNYG